VQVWNHPRALFRCVVDDHDEGLRSTTVSDSTDSEEEYKADKQTASAAAAAAAGAASGKPAAVDGEDEQGTLAFLMVPLGVR
jgi:hypothetical protein